MNILGIIPARFASTRFPGKPLIVIEGKTMIQRVYEQAAKAERLFALVVATDDERIFNHVVSFGGKAVLTGTHHQSGTDRCAEAMLAFSRVDAIINIQGDEPMLDPEQIDQLAACFDSPSTEVATLIKRITHIDEIENPNVVKVVQNVNGEAIYFSRSPIPYLRGVVKIDWLSRQKYFKHIGLYGYRQDILTRISKLKPSFLELSESLEQLRWLENGIKISLRETTIETQAVDTPADLEKLSFGTL